MSGQLLDLFWRVVRGSGSQQVLIDQIVLLVSRSPAQPYQDLVAAIKKVIKSKPESPQAKLQALKVLIPAMRQTGFRAYAAERLLTRLGILARRVKESPGAGLWGAASEQSQEALEASREFGRVLLEALRQWAEDYGEEMSVFRRNYEVGDREEEGLEEVRAHTLLLREVVLSSPSQTSSNAPLCASLQHQITYLRSQLPSLAVRMDELRLQEYLDALESAETVLEDYSNLPQSVQTAQKFDFDFDFPPDPSDKKQEFDFDMHWEDQESSPSQNPQFQVPQFDFDDAQFAFPPADDPNSKLKSLEEQKEQYLKTIESNEKSLEDQLGLIKSLRLQASDAGVRLLQMQTREKELLDEVGKLRLQLNATSKDRSRTDEAVKRREVEMGREVEAKEREVGKLMQKISLFEEKWSDFEPKYIQIQHENEQFRSQIDTFQAEFSSKQQKAADQLASKQKALEQAQSDVSSLVAQVSSLKLALSRDLQSRGVQTLPAELRLCRDSGVECPGGVGRGKNLEISPIQGIAIRPKVVFPRLRLESVFRVSIQSNRIHRAGIESLAGLSITPELVHSQIESIPVDISSKSPGQSAAVATIEVENPFAQDTAILMASLPAPELREQPLLANETWVQSLYQSEQGLLYGDEVIEVRFRTKTEGNNCLMWLLITPKDTQTPSISALSADADSDYSVQISKQVLPSPLLASDPAKVLLCITARTPFAPPPTLDFVCSAAQVTDLRLALPVSFFRFTQPLDCSDLQEIRRLWEELKSTQYSESFEGLKADIRSMGLLRTALACESHFKVLTSLQLPELQRTWLLVCGQVLSLPVLVLVGLRQDASGGVMTAYAGEAQVRKTLVAFVLSLIA